MLLKIIVSLWFAVFFVVQVFRDLFSICSIFGYICSRLDSLNLGKIIYIKQFYLQFFQKQSEIVVIMIDIFFSFNKKSLC